MRFPRKAPAMVAGVMVLVAGLLTGCTGGNGGNPAIPGVVARIGDQEVRRAELEVRARIFELYLQESMAAPEAQYEILVDLVNQRLLAREAAAQGMRVEPAEQDREFQRFMAVLEERYGSPQDLAARMKELSLSRDQIREFVAEFLLSRKAVEALRSRVTVSDEEIRQFYEENRAGLYTFTEEVVRAAHILLPPDQEERAKELVRRVRAGEDFAALAREFSVDPASAVVGGDLGYFRKGDMVPEFAEAAFALKQAGDVSDPVRSQFGWHIIKLLDRRPAGVVPLDAARSDVVNKLLPGKLQAELDRYLEELRTRYQAEILLPRPAGQAPSGRPPGTREP